MTGASSIPSDWDVHTLDAVSVKIQDGTHFSPALGGSEYRYITSRNIGYGRLRLDSVEMISEAEHRKIYRRCDTRFGDLLLTKDGANTGNAAINSFTDEISLLSSVAFVRANHRRSTEGYLLQYLLSGPGRKQIEDAMAGNAITRLTLAKIRALRVAMPGVEEQQRIAGVLRDADDLIDALERKAVKMQAVRQGMMQQLLSGRSRLAGFSDAWNEHPLGDVARIKTGSRNNQDKKPGGQYPFFVRSATVERIDSYSYDCEAVLVPGEGGIGAIFHYINGKFEVHQRVYKISDFSQDVSGRFVFYYMRHYFGAHAMVNSVKATVDSLRLPTFRNFRLRLPRIEEQKALVEVLDDAESEVEALQVRLAKARAIKVGMVQQLLTGRTRLPVKEAAA